MQRVLLQWPATWSPALLTCWATAQESNCPQQRHCCPPGVGHARRGLGGEGPAEWASRPWPERQHHDSRRQRQLADDTAAAAAAAAQFVNSKLPQLARAPARDCVWPPFAGVGHVVPRNRTRYRCPAAGFRRPALAPCRRRRRHSVPLSCHVHARLGLQGRRGKAVSACVCVRVEDGHVSGHEETPINGSALPLNRSPEESPGADRQSPSRRRTCTRAVCVCVCACAH